MRPWTGKPLPKGYGDVHVVVQFRNGTVAANGTPTPAKNWSWEWRNSSWDIVAYARVDVE